MALAGKGGSKWGRQKTLPASSNCGKEPENKTDFGSLGSERRKYGVTGIASEVGCRVTGLRNLRTE